MSSEVNGQNAIPEVSVIMPVYNEAACVKTVLAELVDRLDRVLCRPYEILVVDDGSTDETVAQALEAARGRCQVRLFRHDRNVGQSFAFQTGFRHARGGIVVTIDGDGQNDPADISRVIEQLGVDCDCCCGYRARRQDTFWKRLGSRLANRVRNAVLGEDIRDTGCSLKAFKAKYVGYLQAWDGMHRFFGSLVAMQGGTVRQIPVGHRARLAGVSKYTNWARLKRTVFDLLAVRWLKSRSRVYRSEEL